MNARLFTRLLLVALITSALASVTQLRAAACWPQFRGPNGSGAAVAAKPPARVSPTNGALWRIDVPWSPSSPCVWEDRIFLTTYADGELQTCCYATRDGRRLWSKGIKPEKLEMFHGSDGSPAASTPACDGRRLVSYFGSFGLICFDLKGKELWRHPLPVALSGGGFGTGTSPIIVGKRVLLSRDQDENCSLLAVDLATGKTLWETARPDAGPSFGTPIYWKNKGADQVVMPGSTQLKGYDLKTGQERWLVNGVSGFACTTPVAGDGLLFFAAWSPGKADAPWPPWATFLQKNDKNGDGVLELSEFDPSSRDFVRGLDRDRDGKLSEADWNVIKEHTAKSENVLVAVKPGGQGDITDTHVAWKATRGLPYVPSPLFYDGRLYLVKDGGMMSSFDARTGKPFYLQERVEPSQNYYASPVAAAGRIYLASLPGKLTIIKAGGDAPEVVYQTDFGERIFATPALVGNRMYIRTQTKLYAFDAKKSGSS